MAYDNITGWLATEQEVGVRLRAIDQAKQKAAAAERIPPATAYWVGQDRVSAGNSPRFLPRKTNNRETVVTFIQGVGEPRYKD